MGYRRSASHQALWEPQVVHFDFLIWSQISPCPDTFAFLFTLDLVCLLLLLYWSFLQETCKLPSFWSCPPSSTFQQWTQLQLASFPVWVSGCLHHWSYTGGKLIWWQLHQILLSYFAVIQLPQLFFMSFYLIDLYSALLVGCSGSTRKWASRQPKNRYEQLQLIWRGWEGTYNMSISFTWERSRDRCWYLVSNREGQRRH